MENIYLKSGNKVECNGCGACQYICPVNAIKMVKDIDGFEYPCIDEKKCIHCNKCKSYCSNFNIEEQKSIAYRGINKNIEDLKISSSGGIFLAFATKIIEEKGVVFGVKYDNNMNTIHDYGETLEEIKKFCGSKYVRSDLGNSYNKVKDFLEKGKKVLFTGTSCQVQGLNLFLGKKYDNLLTMDIICHANPSPKIFKKYIEEKEKEKNKKIVNISFRDKKEGWKSQMPVIKYEDGSIERDKTYFSSFVKEMINRPSCYNCKFASPYRISDITIGDLWGVDYIEPKLDTKMGVSLFLINTDKGKKELEKVYDRIDIKEIDFDEAKKYNHFSNVQENFKRKKFFKKIEDGYSVIETMKKLNHDNIFDKIFNKVRKIIGRKNGRR